MATCHLAALGMVNALGVDRATILRRLLAGDNQSIVADEVAGTTFHVARAGARPGSAANSRQGLNRLNALLSVACDQIRPTVDAAKARWGAGRIAVVIGSTDNGSEESKAALAVFLKDGAFPPAYGLDQQEADLPARHVADTLGLRSVSLAISTACTSSASALVYARNLIDLGVCDAVVAGGADIVSDSVLLGFHSLEAVDLERCKPFSANRRGINLGEGAALFLVSREALGDAGLCLAGSGETADAHHMTAPAPDGQGAIRAMRAALEEGGLAPGAIDYINLHGTGTPLNDAMESIATHAVFGPGLPCSSTKALVGHTLGAAGAMELGFCWLLMSPGLNPDRRLPPQVWDGVFDPAVPAIGLVRPGQAVARLDSCMSNSYAFGGCNVSLVIRRVP